MYGMSDLLPSSGDGDGDFINKNDCGYKESR